MIEIVPQAALRLRPQDKSRRLRRFVGCKDVWKKLDRLFIEAGWFVF